MSNGEKVAPVDMEAAIQRDPLFEQVMMLGEGRSYLAVFVVLNPDHWTRVAEDHGLDGSAQTI